MKRYALLCTAIAASLCALADSPDWENPAVTSRNKLPYHATLCLPSATGSCGEVTSLDGTWKFRWSPDPDSRPADFWKQGYDDSGWDEIKVPGNWQTQGFGLPIYTNWTYPFAKDRPKVTSEPPEYYFSHDNRNPVGSYTTEFMLDDPADGNFILHFDGVESAMYVWVNGQEVGYSQNSMSPAEFDITPYVQSGKNRLCAEVYRWSDGSYLEDQDMWRLSGIFRSVQLWKRPESYISDYRIYNNIIWENGVPDEAEMNISISTAGAPSTNLTAVARVGDIETKGRVVMKQPSHKRGGKVRADAAGHADLSVRIPNPRLWSADKPNLYPLHLYLLSGRDTIEHLVNHTGIKEVKIEDNILKVNGKPLKLRGVNRHEHHPQTGRYVDEATIKRDLELMKQAGVNLIRTSHYPNTPLFYELCDIYGIYVMDEAANETHDYGIGTIDFGEDPDWHDAIVERGVSLASRDINNPCVIFWSLGNESTAGTNIADMRRAILDIDPSRPIYYDSDLRASDIFDDAYASPARLQHMIETVKDKPVMMREYAHCMGNSLGNLQDYWDIIYANDNAVGAAVWDWVDQGLKIDHPACRVPATDFAYGGDFGDNPNNGSFNINGIIAPDRTPHPHYYELKKVYQPVRFTRGADGAISAESLDPFTEIGEYNVVSDTVNVDGEKFINVSACLKEDRIWAPKGYAVAREQFPLSTVTVNDPLLSVVSVDSLVLIVSAEPQTRITSSATSDTTFTVVSASNTYVFSDKGDLLSWRRGDREVLAAPLQPYFWKAPILNEESNGYVNRQGVWRNEAADRRLKLSSVTDSTIVFLCSLDKAGADLTVTYSFTERGPVASLDYLPWIDFSPKMPKFGMRLGVPRNMDTISWTGRGPHENYPDRNTGAFVDRYSLPLEQFITTDYVVPQDNSCRTDVRRCSFSDGKSSLKVEFAMPGCLRAYPYTEDDLEKSRHPYELTDCGYINVNLDETVQGVGGNDGWGAQPEARFQIDSHIPRSFKIALSFE